MVMSRLNVAHILAYIADCYGGPPGVALALGREFAKLECTTSFWATGDTPVQKGPGKEGFDINLYGASWPKSWFRCPRLLEALSCKVDSIDIFHIHEVWSWPQYASATLARLKEIPYVFTPHGELEPWRTRSKRVKKRAYLTLIANRILSRAACIHAVAPSEIDGLRKIGYKGPITVIPNGIDPENFVKLPHPSQAEAIWPQLRGQRVVLFLSRLSREKGLDQLIPAWADLMKKSSYRNCLLVLAGPDDRGHRDIVQKLIDKYNLASKILMTGMVRGYQKMALISRSDIYTLPSYSEGFSVSILENMAAGKPVLITTGCNFPEVASMRAGLSVQSERGALAEALIRLLGLSNSELKIMGQKGRDIILTNYTWSVAAQKMKTVYQCILDGKDIPLYPELCDC